MASCLRPESRSRQKIKSGGHIRLRYSRVLLHAIPRISSARLIAVSLTSRCASPECTADTQYPHVSSLAPSFKGIWQAPQASPCAALLQALQCLAGPFSSAHDAQASQPGGSAMSKIFFIGRSWQTGQPAASDIREWRTPHVTSPSRRCCRKDLILSFGEVQFEYCV